MRGFGGVGVLGEGCGEMEMLLGMCGVRGMGGEGAPVGVEGEGGASGEEGCSPPFPGPAGVVFEYVPEGEAAPWE